MSYLRYIFWVFVIFTQCYASSSAEGVQDLITRAVVEEACYDNYWLAPAYRFGDSAKMTIKVAGDTAYVWSSDFLAHSYPTEGPIYFATVTLRDGQVFYIDSQPVSENQKAPDGKTYAQLHATIFGKDSFTQRFQIPGDDCKPKILPDTPLKHYMLEGVLASLAGEFPNSNKIAGGPFYPRHLKVMLAPFNVQDLTVYVFIPSTNEIREAVIHDEDNPGDDLMKTEGGYFIAQLPFDSAWNAIVKSRIETTGTSYWIDLQ